MPTQKRTTNATPSHGEEVRGTGKKKSRPPKSDKRGVEPQGKMDSHPPGSRRDGAGHMDRAYAAELHRLGQKTAPPGKPFIGTNYSDDDLAEHLGEQAIETATSGEDHALDAFDADTPEDVISPFRIANMLGDADEEEEEEE